MTKLISLLATAVVTVFGFANVAEASGIDIDLGNTSSAVTYASDATLSAYNSANIDLLNTSSLTLTGGAQIVNPPATVSGQYVQPSGSIYGSNGGSFVSVYGGTSATFGISLSGNTTSFSFTWGTIDTYNTLTLTSSNGTVYTITGTELLNQMPGYVPGTVNSGLQSDVDFIDTAGTSILSAELTSSQNSFEAANFGTADAPAVPLPASLPLFGVALLGLVVFGSYRRQSQKI